MVIVTPYTFHYWLHTHGANILSQRFDGCVWQKGRWGRIKLEEEEKRREKKKRKEKRKEKKKRREEKVYKVHQWLRAKATVSACPRDRKCEHPACSLKNEITLNTSFSRTMPFNNSWIYAFEREKHSHFTRYHRRMRMKEIDTREQCTTMNFSPSPLSLSSFLSFSLSFYSFVSWVTHSWCKLSEMLRVSDYEWTGAAVDAAAAAAGVVMMMYARSSRRRGRHRTTRVKWAWVWEEDYFSTHKDKFTATTAAAAGHC